MKIRPVGADLFDSDGRIDRQTDRQTDEANGRFVAILRTCLEVQPVSRNFTMHEKCKTMSDIMIFDFVARKQEWAER